jgi:hypothetical protein
MSPPAANLTAFIPLPVGDPPHPPFRSLAADPGNIKFNHWLHMQPGIAVHDAKRKLGLADLDDERQNRYARFANKEGLVQLDCAACHRLGNDGESAPSRGDYMLPISYERHCRACHPLQLNLSAGAASNERPVEVPHGLAPDPLGAVLSGLILAAQRAQIPPAEAAADESGAFPLIPGRTLGKNLAQKLADDVLQRRAKAAAAMHVQCLQCHYENPANESSPSELPALIPANIPAVWLTHARFDHSAHRNSKCRTCHADAYTFEQRDQPRFLARESLPPAKNAAARDDAQVMIANIEVCATCHAPRRGNEGGARHDCAECHLYHGRDAHLQPSRPGGPAGNGPDRKVGVRSVAFQPARSGGAEAPGFLGAQSCAATGCHGDVRHNPPSWASAFNTWLGRDPHVHAYDLLWTHRSRQITRLLSQQPRGAISDSEHSQLLERHCIGCHATPAAGNASRYALGVNCESCHGPASQWLHAHYRAGFVRDATAGFIDTKDLTQRAGACMPCHVGPSDAAGNSQTVSHDLIAAGHPRLNFEFHSYFQSLPAHWDRAGDERRHSPDFHYRSWLAGQTELKGQRQLLLDASGDKTDAGLDFALYECSACHHQLSANHWRQQRARNQADQADALARLLRPFSSALLLPDRARQAPLKERLQWLETQLSAAAQPASASWDRALQAYLAAQAVAADLTARSDPQGADQITALARALAGLGRYLAQDCFSGPTDTGQPPTQYDSPSQFDPAQLTRHIGPVIEALAKLRAQIP